MKSRVVSATEFKAKCLTLLDEIDKHGGTITVTKRGRPVAVLGPARRRRLWKSPKNSWAGKAELPEDLPTADTSELWDVVRQE
jgi:prevent-host-death family protein